MRERQMAVAGVGIAVLAAAMVTLGSAVVSHPAPAPAAAPPAVRTITLSADEATLPATAPRATAASSSNASPADNRWAVLIGISHYEGSTHPTYGGDGDVSAFQTLLHNAGWSPDHVLVLTDGNATGTNMINAMQWLVAHSSGNSFTLFHYSGHVCEQGRGPCSGSHKYLWSVDNRLISDTQFGQIMGGLQGWSWVDVAGCEAAAFDQGVSSSHRFFTGSSMASETSYENPQWHESVWTGTQVDQGMLQHKAASGTGPVSIQQATRWAQQQVPQMTAQQSAGTQHPYAVGGTGEWYLSDPNPAQPPPPPSSSPGSGSKPGGGKSSPPPGQSPVCGTPLRSKLLGC